MPERYPGFLNFSVRSERSFRNTKHDSFILGRTRAFQVLQISHIACFIRLPQCTVPHTLLIVDTLYVKWIHEFVSSHCGEGK